MKRGFTLLELLVAAAITVVLAGLMLALVTRMLNQWSQTTGRLEVAAEARLVLDQLEQDLQGAIFRADGNVWLAATVLPGTTLSGTWKPAAISTHAKPGNSHAHTLDLGALRIEDARFGVAGIWLRFFTTKPDTGATSADLAGPVAVGYQLIRQSVTSSATSGQRYQLFRGEVRRTKTTSGAPGTFEAGYDLDPAAAPATAYMTPNATLGDAGNLLRPPLGSVLADSVIDFGVRLYVREDGALRLVFPARPAGQEASPATGEPTTAVPPSVETEHLARSVAPTANDFYRHAFPGVAEILVRVLDAEGARLIAAYEAGRLAPPSGVSAADYWWTLAEAHSEVFSRRIAISARPVY
jgi:prepilin-type N-terminal cleavage/methylation domain-containing protein